MNNEVHLGRYGNAWPAAFFKCDDTTAFVAGWVVEAKWAHPLWGQYMVVLTHLRNGGGLPVAWLARPGMTHEVIVYALDPEAVTVPGATKAPRMLTPPNHGYQFTAANDAEAAERVWGIVQQVADGAMNPDTDGRAQWNLVFADGASLRRTDAGAFPRR